MNQPLPEVAQQFIDSVEAAQYFAPEKHTLNKTIKVFFELLEEVEILPLGINGYVGEICISTEGIFYRVFYWNNGQKVNAYCPYFELESLPE